jgi:plasmid stabilization system protein ParE
MGREVVWAESAADDLESAAAYIARDSAAYAAAFVREVRAAATSLADFAERGQVVPEVRDPALRELLVRPYRLVYRISKDLVTVVALVHGAMRLGRT